MGETLRLPAGFSHKKRRTSGRGDEGEAEVPFVPIAGLLRVLGTALLVAGTALE